MSSNPLLATWAAPYGLPPFALVHAEHFLPAFAQALGDHRREIDALAAVSDRMCDAIDVLGDADLVRNTVHTYIDAGIDVPILMPLPWGTDRRQVITDTMEAAASA